MTTFLIVCSRILCSLIAILRYTGTLMIGGKNCGSWRDPSPARPTCYPQVIASNGEGQAPSMLGPLLEHNAASTEPASSHESRPGVSDHKPEASGHCAIYS